MQCLKPLKASYRRDGTITFSQKQADPGLEPIKFECRKCLPCRLNIAREKAIRCYHEAQMHENNIFLTLTYSEEHLRSPRLIYADWQNFAKRLRKEIFNTTQQKISTMVTGEYGELNKRPHWHAIIFNYRPQDQTHKYTSDRGDLVYQSETLTNLWGNGMCEYGDVTIDSAGYVARYAAKKLVHGNDQEHDFHPIHRTSSKTPIGRSWIEKYWKQTFDNGFVVLPNGQQAKIPRFYNDWLKKQHPSAWDHYVTHKKLEITELAKQKATKEELEYFSSVMSRPHGFKLPLTRNQVKEKILQKKFKQLQEKLKL